MANTTSAQKAMRQAVRRAARNQAARSAVRTYVKKAAEAVAGSADDAAESVRSAVRALDKAAQKGIVHPNAAARRKSRLMARLHQLSIAKTETPAAEAEPAKKPARRTTATRSTAEAKPAPARAPRASPRPRSRENRPRAPERATLETDQRVGFLSTMPAEQLRSQQRYQRILDAATSVFADKGYHGTLVDDIAEEADTSKGGVYFHFPNKQAIFLALLDRLALILQQRVERPSVPAPIPHRAPRRPSRVVLDTFASHRRLARLFMVEALGAGPEFNARMIQYSRRLRRPDPRTA